MIIRLLKLSVTFTRTTLESPLIKHMIIFGFTVDAL